MSMTDLPTRLREEADRLRYMDLRDVAQRMQIADRITEVADALSREQGPRCKGQPGADTKRLDTLIELVGHYQDSSDTTVRLFQDDATGDCIIKVGRDTFKPSATYYGRSFRSALDAVPQDVA